MSEIRVEGIRAGYGKKEILRGVSLSVDKGELVAIIGPNGAGKSTLLKVIAGFLRPTAGNVLLDGRDITRLARTSACGLASATSCKEAEHFRA